MNKVFSDQLTVHQNILTLCDGNPRIVEAIPGLSTVLEPYRAMVSRLTTRLLELERNTETITKSKNLRKENVITLGTSLAKKLELLAEVEKRPEVLDNVVSSPSTITKGGERALLARLKTIQTRLKESKSAGERFGIVPKNLDEFDTALNAFETALGSPQRARTTHAAEYTRLTTMFTEANQHLRRQLYNAVASEAANQPDFWEEFQLATKIRRTSGSHSPQEDEEIPMTTGRSAEAPKLNRTIGELRAEIAATGRIAEASH